MIKKANIISLLTLFMGTGISAIATIFTTIAIAKYSSVEVFGTYSSILITIKLLIPLCGFGMAQYWLKTFGQHSNNGILWVKKSLIFITLSTILVFITLLLWFNFTLSSTSLILSAVILSLIVFKYVSIEIINSTLQIEGRYFLLSFLQSLQSSSVLLILFIYTYFYNKNLDIFEISMIYLPTVIFTIILLVFIINKFLINIKEKLDLRELVIVKNQYNISFLSIVKESAPFGFAGLFSLIYSQLGIVFVEKMIGADEAAYYSVALTFYSAAILIPIVIYQKFLLPKLHRWAYHDKEKFISSYYLGNKLMLIIGLITFLFLWFASPLLVEIFFGERYYPSVHLIQIVAINIPIVFFSSSAGSLLVTQDHMKTKVYYMGIASLISLVLTAPLINYFGIEGAIFANIISNLFILFIYSFKVKKDILNTNYKTNKGINI